MPSNNGKSTTTRTPCPPRRPRGFRARHAGKNMMTPRFRKRSVIGVKTSTGVSTVPVRGLGYKNTWEERKIAECEASITVSFEPDGGAGVYVNTVTTTKETRHVGHFAGDTKGRTPEEIALLVANNSPAAREMLDALDTLMIGGCGTKPVTLPPLDVSAVKMPGQLTAPVPRSAWTPPVSTVNRTATRQ